MRTLLLALTLLAAPAALAQSDFSPNDALTLADGARLLTAEELSTVGLDAGTLAWAVPVTEAEALGYEIPASVLPPEKETGIAYIIGFLVPGGGQLYAGDTAKGLRFLAIGYGSLVGGSILGIAAGSSTLVLLGYAGYIGATVFGLLEVPDDVAAANRRNGYAVGPGLMRTEDGYAPALSLRASF